MKAHGVVEVQLQTVRRHQMELDQLHIPVPLLLGKGTIGSIDEETEWVAEQT
jgi:hypothetical protein